MSGGIFEPLGPLCRGCIGQSTPGALSHVVSYVVGSSSVSQWREETSAPLELSHNLGAETQQSKGLAEELTENAFPPPFFLSHLPPIPIYFTATSQGRDALVLKVNFLGRCEQVRQKM